ncbi:MAG: HAD-IB family phosphatase [Desulfobacteraceae bacterium]|nr:HAD-IB family phosphatase [Desulfobacteraceae bacterium]
MSEKQKTINLSAIGLDSPGLVSKITKKVFELGGNIIDVEENCRRGLFSIFLIITFPYSSDSMESITDSLKTIEDETGLKVILGEYDEREANGFSEKENHLVTILGMDRPGLIASISGFFLKHNINIENCRMIARGEFFSMEMLIDSMGMTTGRDLDRNEAIDHWKSELKDLCAGLDHSVVIQSENIFNKIKKLIVFDLESTLLEDFSLKDFLETIKGKLKSIDNTIRFLDDDKGEMEAMVGNAKMLRDIPVRDLEKFSAILRLSPGSTELIRVLKSMGFKIAILSSGFDLFVKKILQEAGVDYAFSNTLQVDENDIVTGELEEPVITDGTKEEILEFIMNVEKISRDQVIAIGDGSTRSHFIKNAGLSIAFKPGEKSIKTDGFLSSDQIINLLYCLGIPKKELSRYLEGSFAEK